MQNEKLKCVTCNIYCNSELQLEVHLLSQKHKTFQQQVPDANNNTIVENKSELVANIKGKSKIISL